MHSSHPTSTTYTTQHVLYFSVLHPPHQQDVHQRRTKRRRNEHKKQTNILPYVSYICINMHRYIYVRNITHNNKTCTHPTSTTYYTVCTIFQCPSPSSSTRHTSQRNEGRRETMQDKKNKGTKKSANEFRRLTYKTIQSR